MWCKLQVIAVEGRGLDSTLRIAESARKVGILIQVWGSARKFRDQSFEGGSDVRAEVRRDLIRGGEGGGLLFRTREAEAGATARRSERQKKQIKE